MNGAASSLSLHQSFGKHLSHTVLGEIATFRTPVGTKINIMLRLCQELLCQGQLNAPQLASVVYTL